MTGPDIKTPLPGPKAKALIDRDTKFVSPSYTRGYPLVMSRGEGAIVVERHARRGAVRPPQPPRSRAIRVGKPRKNQFVVTPTHPFGFGAQELRFRR